MKTIALYVVIAFTSATGFSQGTVLFSNRDTVNGLSTHVYAFGGDDAFVIGNIEYYWRVGNTASETPAGSQVYTGAVLAGSGYSAQLFAAPGVDRDWTSLKPAVGITTFRTGTAAGQVAPITATLTDVPKDAPVATLQMRVWNNQGGTITSWQQAAEFSYSAPFNVYNIGGDLNVPASLLGLQSFNMGWYILPKLVPEPSVATIGIAVGALVFVTRQFRRVRSRHR